MPLDSNDPLLRAYSLGASRTRDAGDVNISTPVGSLASSPTTGDLHMDLTPPRAAPSASDVFWGIARVVSTGIGVFHGYRRNNSLGWALVWGVMGSVAPIITPAVALAQGLGEPIERRDDDR